MHQFENLNRMRQTSSRRGHRRSDRGNVQSVLEDGSAKTCGDLAPAVTSPRPLRRRPSPTRRTKIEHRSTGQPIRIITEPPGTDQRGVVDGLVQRACLRQRRQVPRTRQRTRFRRRHDGPSKSSDDHANKPMMLAEDDCPRGIAGARHQAVESTMSVNITVRTRPAGMPN